MGTDAGDALRCAVLARLQHEPLAGTAPSTRRWLCLEDRSAWPHAVGEHPDPAVRELAVRAAAAGFRPLLIRRPGRRVPAVGPVQVFLADVTPPRPRTTALTVDGAAALAALPLTATGPLPGTPVAEPLLFVCTHGRRDRCCALEGRALAATLTVDDDADVWECSHLGGHRFAPTALVLPTGYLYGRLDTDAAVAVQKAAGLGEVEAALCRGRSAWSPAGQVAELAVRAATGLRDADAVTVVAERVAGEVLVTAADGRRWSVRVRPHTGPARPASCGAVAEPVTALAADTPRPLA
jgi:hypothetical protein